jgi:hypothetical protein
MTARGPALLEVLTTRSERRPVASASSAIAPGSWLAVPSVAASWPSTGGRAGRRPLHVEDRPGRRCDEVTFSARLRASRAPRWPAGLGSASTSSGCGRSPMRRSRLTASSRRASGPRAVIDDGRTPSLPDPLTRKDRTSRLGEGLSPRELRGPGDRRGRLSRGPDTRRAGCHSSSQPRRPPGLVGAVRCRARPGSSHAQRQWCRDGSRQARRGDGPGGCSTSWGRPTS